MRTLFSALAIVLLIVAIICFIASLKALVPTLACTIPKLHGFYDDSAITKKGVGTVTDVSEVGSSSTGRSGRVYNALETRVTIQFHDEKGHLLKITCNPIFNFFKKGQSVKVSYLIGPSDEQDAERHTKRDASDSEFPTATRVKGVPISIYYWFERPLLFFIIGIVALIVRLAPIALRNFEP
jgi:hypothetical protein